MHVNFALQLQLCDSPQVFSQNFLLDLKLVLVARVLVMASATTNEMGTRRGDAVRRTLNNRLSLGARKAGLFFGECRFDFLSDKDKRDKDGLAASAVVGGKASESITAVDQLFNV